MWPRMWRRLWLPIVLSCQMFHACLLDWHLYDGSCYRLISRGSPFVGGVAEARQLCRSLAANIVTIKSDGEQNHVANLVQMSGNPPVASEAYMGLGDGLEEMSFTWFDGDPLTYSNWANNEPNHYLPLGGENCASMIIDKLSSKFGQWFDVPCQTNPRDISGVICEAPLHSQGRQRGHLEYTTDMYPGRYLDSVPLVKHRVASRLQCVAHCMYNNVTLSLNYSHGLLGGAPIARNCVCNGATRYESRGSMLTAGNAPDNTPVSGWTYLEIWLVY